MNHKKGELASLVVVGIMLVITIILVLVKGDYLLKTKIFRGNELVTEAEHEVKLE